MNEKEEYRVLARKYRPQFFSDLIGQETLVQTLTNAILNNRIAHAYLLTGVRGIGKTTTARIIAMSLNCETRQNNSSEPCGNCESCFSIRNDRNMDVIEIDAASKTGVDDIREIIDNVKYKPVKCKYKIFIIDEVHMLSKSAFNALLKTLEEPPPHIKFIFATTEVQKIPITIISRCQKFDLRRIEIAALNKHLTSIALKEKISIDKDSIALISRAADGSVRDALSLLDQSINNSENQITSDSIILMLGLASRDNIFDLIDKIFKGEAEDALEIYNKIHESGTDVLMIFNEMLNIIHFLTLLKISPSLKDDMNIPEIERTKGIDIAEKISMSSLGIAWQILFKGYSELRTSFNIKQHGEMLIIRLIYLHDGPSPNDLIKKFEENIKDQSFQNDNIQEKKKIDNISSTVNEKKQSFKFEENKKNTKHSGSLKINSFRNFVDLFYQKREGMMHSLLYNNVKLVSFKEGEIILNTESISDPHFTRTVAKFISKWTGRIWQVSTSTSNIGKSLFEEDLINQQREIDIMQKDIEIKKILNKYQGVKIHSISDIKEIEDEININLKSEKFKEK